MAPHTYGRAGAGVQRMALRTFTRLIVGAAVGFGVWWSLTRIFSAPPWAGLAALGATLLVFEALEGTLDRQFTGRDAELDVARVLGKLPDDYHVLHDLDLGRGNVDHVVIGPTGVFVIETKSQQGFITVKHGELRLNRRKPDKDFLKQAYAESMAVRDHLIQRAGIAYTVHPVLVFTRAKVRAWEASGVRIASVAELLQYIQRNDDRIDAASAQAAACALAPYVQEPTPTDGDVPAAPGLGSALMRMVPQLALLGMVAIGFYWLTLGGGLETMLCESVRSMSGSPTSPAPASAPSADVTTALGHLQQHAPDHYSLVANRNEPRISPNELGGVDYTWEWIDTSVPSAATVKTVTIRLAPDGSWAGLSFGP